LKYLASFLKIGVVLRHDNWFGAMARSAEQNPALMLVMHNKILRYGP
jgi:hypothetical protein